MEESGSSTSYPSSDPGWKYFQLVTPGNKNDLKCSFCSNVFKGGIFRAKQHLVGGYRNASACKKCPSSVREEIRDFMNKKKSIKYSPIPSNEYDQDEEPSRPSETRSTVTPSLNKRKRQDPMDNFVQEVGTAEPRVQQMTMTEAFNMDLRENCIMAIANWMYDAAIPFNAVKYPSFQVMCDTISRYGPGFKGPSLHEVQVPCLDKAVKEVEEDYIAACRNEWKTFGCSLMVDSWTDKRQRTLINFLVNSPRGSVFIESVDASEYAKTGEKMAELIEKVIVKIGAENVIQVISDNAGNMVLAGEKLEERMPHLYWTPCAAHCINLMLEDIGKLPAMKLILKKAMSVTSYVYARPGVVNMMRKFTERKELCRAGITRVATPFLTLKRMFDLKQKLKSMFTSDDWAKSKWSKEADGKKVAGIIMSPSFWNGAVHILKIYSPLVQVLKLVDGGRKPSMGYIYEAMDRAKEAIVKAFDDNEEKYKNAFVIIDQRWSQLHRPLHAAAFFLNPQFFYKHSDVGHVDNEVNDGFFAVMDRYVPNALEQDKIASELSMYRRAQGLFGLPLAIRQRELVAPAIWWENFGSSAPSLRKLAIRVLSLTCSSSRCERNWSIFEDVHSKRRNRLEQQRMNDLVFVKYNRALKHQFDARDQIVPISLATIDESNEWLIGIVDEENEFVFGNNDGLTWGVTATALGLDEPAYATRAKGKQPATTSAPKQVEKGKGTKGKGKRKGKSVGGGSSSHSAFILRDEEEIEFDHLEGHHEEEEKFDEENPNFDDEEEEEE